MKIVLRVLGVTVTILVVLIAAGAVFVYSGGCNVARPKATQSPSSKSSGQ